jgi:hypothetical protein
MCEDVWLCVMYADVQATVFSHYVISMRSW